MATVHEKSKSVCVIGAGLAGLTTAALLVKKGYTVHVFEKEAFVGGRALSLDGTSLTHEDYLQILSKFHMHLPFAEPDLDTVFEHHLLDGYTLDLGFHTIGGGVVSNLQKILSSLHTNVDMLGSRLGYLQPRGGFRYPFLSAADKIKMLPRIFRLVFADEKTMNALDTVSMTETIQRYGKGKMKLTLELFSRVITTVNNLDSISTGETFRAQKGLLSGSSTPVGYPKKGLASITKVFADYITNNGGTLHLNTPVKELLIDDQTVHGVSTSQGETRCDTVISNMLVQDLFSVAAETSFPSKYVHALKTLQGTGSLCAYYSLNHVPEKIIGKTFLFIERDAGVDGTDAVGMIDTMTALPACDVSPSNKHLIQAYLICTPEEARDKKTLERLRTILDTWLKHLIPDYEAQMNWAVYPAVWQLDGVAKTIHNQKPEIRTPVKNLFVIGDCVKASGIGMNCALNSAQQVISLI